MYRHLTAILIGSLSSSNAAEISWTKADLPVTGEMGTELSTGVLKKDGELIFAENLGGKTTTYDGITFSESEITFGNKYEAYHVEEMELSRTGTWNDDPVPAEVTLTKLSVGRTYRVQAIIYDGRDIPSIIGKTVSFDGQNMGCYAHAVNGVTWGKGLVVTGRFIADAPTQTFNIDTFILSTGSVGGQLNAILLHKMASPQKVQKQIVDQQQSNGNSETSALIQIGGIAVHLSP